MKTKRRFCFLLLFLLCMQLVSCASPEDPSDPVESSEAAPVPEDPNAAAARAYLEELLAAERETGNVEWLTEEQAETVRACVKTLNAPFLTEADVIRIAERAAFVIASEQTQSQILPACGVLAAVVWSPMADGGTREAFYTALVAYTLYLFTPPDYVFRGEEVWDGAAYSMLYLPLAGEPATRMEALDLLRQGKSGVQIQPVRLAGEEHPLDCSLCGTSVLYSESGEVLTLDLLKLAEPANVTLPEDVFIARAETYVQEVRDSVLFGTAGVYGTYDLPSGDNIGVYLPLTRDAAQMLREQTDLLPAPLLDWELADLLVHALLERVDMGFALLLPGVDGGEDVLVPQGMESPEDRDRLGGKDSIPEKACWAAAYLIDLFTPSDCRFTDLFGAEGTYYMLRAESDDEDVLYIRVLAGQGLYLVDAYHMEPLLLVGARQEGWTV